MPGINNNLYPPIFTKTFMPAFLRLQTCRVYFSISIYNALSDLYHDQDGNINGVQIIVQNQKTNRSALNQVVYPSGIKLTTLGYDETRPGDDKYYVEISSDDIQGGEFKINQYYKVQIRFTAAGAEEIPKPESKTLENGTTIITHPINTWLSQNLQYFSEWSTVVLIRGIDDPTLVLRDFNAETKEIVFTSKDVVVVGHVNFTEGEEETLKSYRIYLYDIDGVLLQDSGDIYANSRSATNEINYVFSYNFDTNVEYILGVQITTKNLYSWPEIQKFKFSIDEVLYTIFDANISSIVDESAGRIGIHLQNERPVLNNLNLIIRRSSSKSQFQTWEDIYSTTYSKTLAPLDFTWYDYTVESGVFYKYRAQTQNSKGYRSSSVELKTPVMVVPEDIFLLAEGKQLKVRFDPQVSNYSHNIAESKTDTIGSKYPFIRRNGNINYRSFSLSGTITHFMDAREDLMAASRTDLYGQSKKLYTRYNDKNRINDYNDYIYERDFRQQVIDFLYKNNVKLYKSTTEGNMLVKLMDISFTPNNTLDRRIYSFSCTAVQIDDCTPENILKYNIIPSGLSDEKELYNEMLGQIERPSKDIYYPTKTEQEVGEQTETFYVNPYSERKYEGYWQTFGTEELLTHDILDKYQKLNGEGLVFSIDHLKYLKIELTNPPYMIKFAADGTPLKADTNADGAAQTIGHIVKINDKYVVINKEGIYELTDKNTEITSLQFPYDGEQGLLSFIAVTSKTEDVTQIPKAYASVIKLGQFWGFFEFKDSIYQKLRRKYNQTYQDDAYQYKEQLQSILGMRITALPGTVFYTRESQDAALERHVINSTEVLEFYDEDTSVHQTYFWGMHLLPAVDPQNVRETEYIETGIEAQDFAKIENPIQHGVYTITKADLDDLDYEELDYNQKTLIDNLKGAIRFIYYDGKWYVFTTQNDVALKTCQGMVDYYCRLLKRRFEK